MLAQKILIPPEPIPSVGGGWGGGGGVGGGGREFCKTQKIERNV